MSEFTVRGAVAALGLVIVALTSPSHAQLAPDLGTAASFAVLAGSTVTNTGTSVITGDIGVSPGTAITGFPPGTLTGTIHLGDAVAAQAQIDNTTAYNNLAGRPTTVDLTGQNLGGKVLVPGVYNFATSAQLTGTLTLNGLGNPASVFIFNIGSTLTTASASAVALINSASGGNVFWRVGSSATLGTATSFNGDILALTSITLNTGATIVCGDALAKNGAVTLDTNTIKTCAITKPTVTTTAAGTTPTTTTVVGAKIASGVAVLGPAGFPLFLDLLPAGSNNSQNAVATALDSFINVRGGTLPLAFVNLFNLAPSDLAAAFSQLQGEAGTGAAQAGTQAMNSFLPLLTNPFANNRPFAEYRSPMIVKARGYAPESPQSPAGSAFASLDRAPSSARRWSVWGAAYGGQNNANGDLVAGSHERSARIFGYAVGLDYLATPYTTVGFALSGGSTHFGLADGFGDGHSEMLQAAVYSTTYINSFYVSAAFASAWHRYSTDRNLTVAGNDHLTADFNAEDVGGRIEGGYRFDLSGIFDSPWFGVTPYTAVQVQAFHMPSYSEKVASGSSTFALAYDARTTTTTRTELGSWVDKSYALDRGNMLSLFGRAAWAHDWYSDPEVTATFLALPGTSFIETGAPPAKNSALLTAGAELYMRNGWSVMAKLDSELAHDSHTYIGTAQLRYTW